MKHFPIRKAAGYSTTALAFAILAACGDDDSFSPMAKDRGYDYAYTTAKDLSKTPCNEMRDGREAVIGKNKDRYECEFDYQDSVYLWVGYSDTLTAEGREYHRTESSSSEDDEDISSSSSNDPSTSSGQALSGDSHEESSSSSVAPSSSSSNSSSSSVSSSSSNSSSSSISSSSYSSSSVSSSSNSSSSISSSSERFSKMDVEPLLKEKGEQFNPKITYGTIKDTRDGQVYRTVVVNGQTWMAENLNYAGHSIGESFCFNEDSAFCNFYGRLYSRDAALNSTKCVFRGRCELGSGNIQGVCPSGWHIPSYAEAESLRDFVDSNAVSLRSAKGWDADFSPGTDTYGFSAVAAGSIWPNSPPDFSALGYYEAMWVHEQSINSSYLLIGAGKDRVEVDGFTTFPIHLSVRCIANKAPASSSSAKSSSSVSSSSISSSSSSSSVSSSSVKSSSSISSSSESSSSIDPSIYQLKESFFNSEKTYGEMTDTRDGKKYKTISVNGLTWMAENLNYAGSDVDSLQKKESVCYDNKAENCVLYGRLYSRAAAVNDASCAFGDSCKLGDGPIRGACPNGWRIPTSQEGKKLKDFVNTYAKRLMSANGWNDNVGSDTYGLSLVGSGDLYNGEFKNLGIAVSIWLYSQSDEQVYFQLNGANNTVTISVYKTFELYNSIRCVKN